MNEYLPEKILENESAIFANLRVIRVDEDINPLSFDLEDIKVNNEYVKIKKHKPNDDECPCIENGVSVVKYNGQVKKLGQDLKRKNDDKLDVEVQKCMKTGDSYSTAKLMPQMKQNDETPSLTYDNVLLEKSLIKNGDFFKNNFDAMISNGNRNAKIRWIVYVERPENDQLKFGVKIGFWYQLLYEKENGECFSEESETFVWVFDNEHKKILEKSRAFEQLEYKLSTMAIDECDEEENKKPSINNRLFL